MTYRHSVSVAAAIYDQEKDAFLLIRRADNGAWQLPGGVLEKSESFSDGVRRETYEETGARVSVSSLSGIYKNPELGVVALVFRCSFDSGTLRTSEESTEVEWIKREKIPHLVSEAFACRLLDSLESGVHLRTTDGRSIIAD